MSRSRAALLDSALVVFLFVVLLGPLVVHAQPTSAAWPTRTKPTDAGALPPGSTLDWQGHRVVMTTPFVAMPIDFDGWYPDIKGDGLAVFINPRFRAVGLGRVLQGGYNGGNPSLLVIGGEVDGTGHNTVFESGFAWQGTGDATFIDTRWPATTLDHGSWYGSGKMSLIGGWVGPFCLAAPPTAHCEPFHIFGGKAAFRRVAWDLTGLRGALTGGMTAPTVFVEGVTAPASAELTDNTIVGTATISSPPGCMFGCTTATLYIAQAAKRQFPTSIMMMGNSLSPGVSGHVVGLSGGATATGSSNIDARTGQPLKVFP